MDNTLISIITPAYNSALYIEKTIQSVLNQTNKNWELLIVNDGSTDNTEEIVKQFADSRIRYLKKENGGVSSARNLALQNMNGDYFCFLDADDSFPKQSLENRMLVFNKSEQINFVDGTVLFKDQHLENTLKTRIPQFTGNPINALCHLNEKCFFGNTWMFKRDLNTKYEFLEGLTHGEDLLFYLQYVGKGNLDYTEKPILNYRTGNTSAMTNLNGLEKGYRTIAEKMKNLPHVSEENKQAFKSKTKSIMFKSYLGNKQVINAFRVLLTW